MILEQQLISYKARIVMLEEENETLRERIRQISGAEQDYALAISFNLTKNENLLLTCLMKKDMCTRQVLMNVLYSQRIDREPDIKIVDVLICKFRAKLKPYGVIISLKWGFGYYLTKETKQKIIELTQQFRGQNELSSTTPIGPG